MNEQTEYSVALEQTAAPSPEPSLAERIASAVEDFGINAPPGFVLTMEREVHREAFKLGGEALHRLSLRLPKKSVAAAALGRVIRGAEGESLREAGRRCGASAVAVWKAEKRIRHHLTLTTPPLVSDEREEPISDCGRRSGKAAGQQGRDGRINAV